MHGKVMVGWSKGLQWVLSAPMVKTFLFLRGNPQTLRFQTGPLSSEFIRHDMCPWHWQHIWSMYSLSHQYHNMLSPLDRFQEMAQWTPLEIPNDLHCYDSPDNNSRNIAIPSQLPLTDEAGKEVNIYDEESY